MADSVDEPRSPLDTFDELDATRAIRNARRALMACDPADPDSALLEAYRPTGDTAPDRLADLLTFADGLGPVPSAAVRRAASRPDLYDPPQQGHAMTAATCPPTRSRATDHEARKAAADAKRVDKGPPGIGTSAKKSERGGR